MKNKNLVLRVAIYLLCLIRFLYSQTTTDKIAFHSNRSGTPEIYIMNIDGTNDSAITNLETVSEFPTWSPDGKYIVFQTNRDGNFEIYTIDPDGSHLQRITKNTAFDGRPTWGRIKF